MTWLIFALATVLALAGAISIASGVPYIQMEWGWTETIAGAVALSAGVITFALGAILYRLAAMHRALRNGVGLLPAGMPGSRRTADSDDARFSLPESASSPAPLEPFEPATLRPRTGYGSAEAVVDLDYALSTPASPEPTAQAEPSMSEAPVSMVLERVPEIDSEAPPRVPWTARLRSRLRKAEPVPTTPVADPELGLDLRPTSDPHQAEAGAAPGLDLSDQAVAPPGFLGEDPGAPSSETSSPEGSRQGSTEDDGPFRRAGIADAETAPTIVGRYEAAGVSYFLLSDGAIEVKTETGLHRFDSMQELKVFIEAQELQVSTQDR